MRKRDLILLAAGILTALALALGVMGAGVLPVGAWGLSFPQEGQPPRGPASAQQLEKFGGAYLGDTNQKVIYLTFDAGYENGCTGKILDVLKAHNVPAAFFLVGHYMQTNPDLVRRMAAEGHTVGNHTMHHPDMSRVSDPAAFEKELRDLEALYKEITGGELPKYYRPPQGLYSKENLEMAQKLGYKTVFWSLAYVDWDQKNQPSRQAAMEKLMSRIHNGAVVLLHSTSTTNAEILDELLTRWERMGYRFATLDELFGSSRASP